MRLPIIQAIGLLRPSKPGRPSRIVRPIRPPSGCWHEPRRGCGRTTPPRRSIAGSAPRPWSRRTSSCWVRGLLNRGMTGLGIASLGAARDANPDHPETLDAIIAYSLDNETLAPGGPGRRASDPSARLGSPRHDPPGEGTATTARTGHRRGSPDRGPPARPRATRQAVDQREIRKLLAACLLEAGRFDEAGRELKRLLSSGPDPEGSWLLSRALLMRGDSAGAKAALEESGDRAHRDPLAVEPSPYVGAAGCASCHAVQFKAQQQSRHARTIKSKAELAGLPWPETPLTDRDNPSVIHRFRHEDDGVEAETRVEDRTYAAVVEYAMGSNHQGRSFVGRDREGQARELRVSQYPPPPTGTGRPSTRPSLLARTDTWAGRSPTSRSAAASIAIRRTSARCSSPRAGRSPATTASAASGVTAPGRTTSAPIEGKFPDPAIARPRLASAAQVMTLCGQCHKAPESASPSSPNFIRFQAPTLVTEPLLHRERLAELRHLPQPPSRRRPQGRGIRGDLPPVPSRLRAPGRSRAARSQGPARHGRPARSIPGATVSAATCRGSRMPSPARSSRIIISAYVKSLGRAAGPSSPAGEVAEGRMRVCTSPSSPTLARHARGPLRERERASRCPAISLTARSASASFPRRRPGTRR